METEPLTLFKGKNLCGRCAAARELESQPFFFETEMLVVYDVLQLEEVGDFGDENCLPPLNLIRSTKLHLTTEPPISCSCCYGLVLYVFNKFLHYEEISTFIKNVLFTKNIS